MALGIVVNAFGMRLFCCVRNVDALRVIYGLVQGLKRGDDG